VVNHPKIIIRAFSAINAPMTPFFALDSAGKDGRIDRDDVAVGLKRQH